MFLNRKGVSLLYVLMALVCVGAVGSLVLNMAKKESGDSSLRKSSELARFASTAGLVYAANFFTNPEKEPQSYALLQKWYNYYNTPASAPPPTEDEKWIVGDKNTYYNDPDTDMKFRARVVDMDFSKVIPVTVEDPSSPSGRKIKSGISPKDQSININIECESIDKSGSRAKNTGFYRIAGYEKFETPNEEITNALYLGGGNMWIHCPIEVIGGDTYIGNRDNNSQAVYQSAGLSATTRSDFHGEFRMYQAPGVKASDFMNVIFHGPAYFEGGDVTFLKYNTTPTTFEKGFGGSTMFYSQTSNLDVSNGTSSKKNRVVLSNGFQRAGSYSINMLGSNTELYYLSTGQYYNYPNPPNTSTRTVINNFPTGGVTGSYTPYSRSNITNSEALDLLGMSTIEPPAFTIDLSQIESYAYNVPIASNTFSISGAQLQTWYNNPPAPLYNKNGVNWLVIKISGGVNIGNYFQSGGSGFTGKAIIIYEAGSGQYLPNVAPTGNVLFYVPSTVSTTKIDFNQLQGNFRGLFYNGSAVTNLNLSAALTGWGVTGAFYNAPGAVGSVIQFGAGAAGKITVTFDKSALNELQDLGIIKFDGSSSTTPPTLQRLPAYAEPYGVEFIKAEQVGRLF